MADWDGRGLPPVAAERVRRAAAGGPWTSLLTAPAAAGLEVAGFDPVGEVMGSIVMQIGWSGFRGCGAWGTGAWGNGVTFGATRTVTSSAGGYVGYGPYVAALNHGYETAMGRMLQEAAGIGADGVVGVLLKTDHLDANNREFVALGTAVRSRGQARPRRPFNTSLPAQDVAKLVTSGWMPTDLVFGISVAVRHDDWRTQQQSSWGAGNMEVSGYTDLVHHVRADARAPCSAGTCRRRGPRGRSCRRWACACGRSSRRRTTATTSPRRTSSAPRSCSSVPPRRPRGAP